ncbi:hypothetical protein QNI16_38020 [Cytophagaceae bacterium YF14B1]|uniref:Uncharacterized protein n=1 Tax=Xanthocytophaga flava TaxID=3048013 RepID=A0AAE3R0Y1_9BACT|nr:hypothetical protein [Xanthocytophaga flavus]MDJ1486339.1 hypothetical protein [Xanthocytophaga flavus]
MEYQYLIDILKEFQKDVAFLKEQALELKRRNAIQEPRIGMEEAEHTLGVSHMHMQRLIGAGVVCSGIRIGSGKNARWTFSDFEIRYLAQNPGTLILDPVS